MKFRFSAAQLTSAAGILALLAPGSLDAQWLDLRLPERPDTSAAMVEAGKILYADRCWFCHGEDGLGDGPVAPYLWPRPRDFTMGSYKLRTTESGELPTDEDLYRTISLGLPGTAMPAWESVLTPQERWQLVAYLKTFAADLFEDEAFDPYQFIVDLPDMPGGSTDSLIARGSRVFEEADCWECHGYGGRGDGEKAAELTDDWDFPIQPANLRLGWKFKGGTTAAEAYLRLSGGLDGTPMPSYAETLSEEERWQLAAFVASLAQSTGSDRSAGAVIVARRLSSDVPVEPGDPVWQTAREVSVPMSGQATYAPRWQVPAISDLAVRAVYNDREIAFRLEWDDRWADTLAADPTTTAAEGWEADDTYPVLYPDGERVRGWFADAVEIMFPVRHEGSLVLPHLVYGNAGQPVDLWRWRADHQFDVRGPGAVLELRADGGDQPPEPHDTASQLADGTGVWTDGRWSVVIRRPLSTADGTSEVQVSPGQYVPVAFHGWEGSNGETGLRMALSSWYFVYLREPVPLSSYLIVLLTVVFTLAAEYGLVRWT
ncbi:MAG: ethylbenzene dehydrogenase-related protein, partial [Gemmatimonadota bacterium]